MLSCVYCSVKILQQTKGKSERLQQEDIFNCSQWVMDRGKTNREGGMMGRSDWLQVDRIGQR